MGKILEVAKNNAKTVLGVGSLMTVFSMFGVFYTFDSIYARAADLKEVQTAITKQMEVQQKTVVDMIRDKEITELDDKIFIIDSKENPSKLDRAIRQRYESRKEALMK